MQRAGFILAGGQSSRMGRDKAVLPWRGATLVENIAELVASVAGSATIVGPADRYQALGLSVLPDLRPGLGPLSGLETALTASTSEWNLVLACDLINVDRALLVCLFDRAEASNADVTVARDASGFVHPLCAVYNRRCLAAASAALDRHELRLLTLIDTLNAAFVDTTQPLLNVNTPEEWLAARTG
jgi:molybdopterin-guanine dinucleotide biosynthesis protein A